MLGEIGGIVWEGAHAHGGDYGLLADDTGNRLDHVTKMTTEVA